MTLDIDNVAVRYGERVALTATRLALAGGEIVGLVGPNGAGKSSLVKAIAGLVPHAGFVAWNGTRLDSLSHGARARAIAYLPQAAIAHWPMTARDIVALGRLPHRPFGAAPSAADDAAVERAMAATESFDFGERSVLELSIGERARVTLARALAVEAPVLLADEPTAMLDPLHQLAIMAVLRAYARGGEPPANGRDRGAPPPHGAVAGAHGRLVVAVLHDLTLAARFCDRVVVVERGAVVADDSPERALTPEVLERRYRVAAHFGNHEGEPLIVPWRPLV
jgi:iron complex transport system ATP-binding protein